MSVNIEIATSLNNLKVDFDAVIICTPNGIHHLGAIDAANLGKHVLIEKPLDISLKAMDKMITKCKVMNVKLGVAFQRRMNLDNQLMKKLIDEGKLGKIFAADLTVKNYRDEQYYKSGNYRGTKSIDGGGPFMQQASHNIDLYVWFFGMPKIVMSMLGNFTHDIESEDHGAALLRFDNGMIGTVIGSTSTKPGFDPRLEIHSEKGSIIMENDIITHWSIEGIENPSKSSKQRIHSGATSAAVSGTSAHEKIIKDFVNSVRENKKPFISGEDARNTTELILEIYKNEIR